MKWKQNLAQIKGLDWGHCKAFIYARHIVLSGATLTSLLLETLKGSDSLDPTGVVPVSKFKWQSDLPIADQHPQTDGIKRGG